MAVARPCEHDTCKRCAECTRLARNASSKAYSARRREDPEYRARLASAQREYTAQNEDYRERQRERAKARLLRAEARVETARYNAAYSGNPWALEQESVAIRLLSQPYLCYHSCGAEESTLPRRLCIDHDHVTGLVRGLLCVRCNNTLGAAQDQVEILKQVGCYLEKSKTDSTGATPNANLGECPTS